MTKNIIGGSESYLNVINTKDICCSETQNNINNNPNYKFPELKVGNITAKDIVYNYGISNKTTGGGLIKESNKNIKKFLKKVVDNRILDIYLKYMGIKTLTTSTLVPIALIMGKDTLVDAINFIINSDNQKGGGNFLENKIPVLDDELIGNYLKIAGLTTINLSISTLLPLGIVMSLYGIYNKNSKKVGGGRFITGQSIPTNIVQDMGATIQGRNAFQDGIHGYLGGRSSSTINNDMHIYMPEHQFNSSENLLQPYPLDVHGFNEHGINDNNVILTIGAKNNNSNTVDSVNPRNCDFKIDGSVSDKVGFLETHPEHTQAWSSDILLIPDSMAGGGINETESISTEVLLDLANPLFNNSDDDLKSLNSDSDISENELVNLDNKFNFFTPATEI